MREKIKFSIQVLSLVALGLPLWLGTTSILESRLAGAKLTPSFYSATKSFHCRRSEWVALKESVIDLVSQAPGDLPKGREMRQIEVAEADGTPHIVSEIADKGISPFDSIVTLNRRIFSECPKEVMEAWRNTLPPNTKIEPISGVSYGHCNTETIRGPVNALGIESWRILKPLNSPRCSDEMRKVQTHTMIDHSRLNHLIQIAIDAVPENYNPPKKPTWEIGFWIEFRFSPPTYEDLKPKDIFDPERLNPKVSMLTWEQIKNLPIRQIGRKLLSYFR